MLAPEYRGLHEKVVPGGLRQLGKRFLNTCDISDTRRNTQDVRRQWCTTTIIILFVPYSGQARYRDIILLREPSNGMHRIICAIESQVIHLECEAEERTKIQL